MEKWRHSLTSESDIDFQGNELPLDMAGPLAAEPVIRNYEEKPASASFSVPEENELSFWRKLLFGMAAPPLQMSSNVVGFFFNIFLLEVAKIHPLYTSVILFTGRAWDAITDPIAGQLVSKTNTRWGRCRPWMALSAPVGCAIFFLLWVPVETSEPLKFVYYLIMYLLYCTLITCYHVPYTSSTMLIAKSAKDKDGATAFRMTFELLGTIVGVGLFGIIISSRRIASDCSAISEELISESKRQAEKDGYYIGAIVIVTIYLACGLSGFFGIKEKYNIQTEAQESFLVNIKAVLTFKPYIQLMMAFLFMSLGVQIVQVNLALYTTHSLDLGTHVAYGIVVVLGVAILAIPFWYKMSVKFGKKNIFMTGIILFIPGLWAAMIVPAKSVFIYYTILAFSGLAISVSMLLPWSLLPDVIDDYYVRNGTRREATFYSLYVFFNKFAVGISMAASQVILSIADYDSSSCEQDHSVNVALRYMIGPAPIVSLLTALIILYFFPITKKYRQEISNKLTKMNTDKNQPAIQEKPVGQKISTMDAPVEGIGNNAFVEDEMFSADIISGYNKSTVL